MVTGTKSKIMAGPLKTLNFYVPPAYTKSGEELPRAKP
jgi:hypothetical protein